MKICVSYPVDVCYVIIFSFSILDQVDILILLINLLLQPLRLSAIDTIYVFTTKFTKNTNSIK